MEILANLIDTNIQIIYILPIVIFGIFRNIKTIKSDQLIILISIYCFLMLQSLGMEIPRLEIFNDLHWNWQYKIYQILLSIIFSYCILRKPTEVGIRLPTKESLTIMWIVLGGMILFSTIVAVIDKTIMFSSEGSLSIYKLPIVETFLFEATMPGLSEELLYRGILLLGLNKIFIGDKIRIADVEIGLSFPISIILFILSHNTFVDVNSLEINILGQLANYSIMDWILNIISSGFMTWIVLRTKSIVPAIIMHSYAPSIGPLLVLLFG
jgi:membrane protease YdiL (CAAX protease family)